MMLGELKLLDCGLASMNRAGVLSINHSFPCPVPA